VRTRRLGVLSLERKVVRFTQGLACQQEDKGRQRTVASAGRPHADLVLRPDRRPEL